MEKVRPKIFSKIFSAPHRNAGSLLYNSLLFMNPQLADFAECIGSELADVERRFTDELTCDLKCVASLVKHVNRFRGKMLRPCLVLLAGKAVGSLSDAHITLAAVVEMVHMATLVHDDVLDEAELRRKGATINHLRGNEAAVLLGDYLISHSYHLCSTLDSQFAARLIARTTNTVCEGELLQIDNRGNFDLDEETYFQIITRKTASLCATSCLLGAKYANADDYQQRQLELFGLSLGIAFQIQDDILDIVGETSTVGKTLGIDIEKGKMTLPMIHFMQHALHWSIVICCGHCSATMIRIAGRRFAICCCPASPLAMPAIARSNWSRGRRMHCRGWRRRMRCAC